MKEKLFFQRGLASAEKLNKAEFASLARGFISHIKAAGAEVLHVPAEKLALFEEKYLKLEDLVAISWALEETDKIADINADVEALVKFILAVIRNGKDLCIPAKKAAANSLSYATRAYNSVYRLPQAQKVQTIQGMLRDFSKSDATELIEALCLTQEIEMLTLKNAQYDVLLNSRASIQIANHEEKTTLLRQEMSELYIDIAKTIWAFSIAEPSEDANEFIKSMNKMIADMETSNKQRLAQTGKKEEEESLEGNDEEEPSTNESSSDENPTTT